MRSVHLFRKGKPGFYPDQSVYAEYACAEFGLRFTDIDGGTGLLFNVASSTRSINFGAGRASWYPQNNATASTLASDKFFASRILAQAGVAALGGEYFFLHDRHRAHRPAGHEREDAREYLKKLGGSAFVKPLTGSRGDFAQAVHDAASLIGYLDEVARYYDAVVMQPLTSGIEYRVFLLDGEVLYAARKYPPSMVGDGVSSFGELLAAHNRALLPYGLSPAPLAEQRDAALDAVLPNGERREISGRMNLSAGGTMVLETAAADLASLAAKAAHSLGLRVAAVDLFTDIGGAADAMAVIEVNSNPSIRLLEQSDRGDLILLVWHHTFSAMGLL